MYQAGGETHPSEYCLKPSTVCTWVSSLHHLPSSAFIQSVTWGWLNGLHAPHGTLPVPHRSCSRPYSAPHTPRAHPITACSILCFLWSLTYWGSVMHPTVPCSSESPTALTPQAPQTNPCPTPLFTQPRQGVAAPWGDGPCSALALHLASPSPRGWLP